MKIEEYINKWNKLNNNISNEDIYTNTNLSRIVYFSNEGNNHTYISNNRDNQMTLYVEFDNVESVKLGIDDSIEGISISFGKEKMIDEERGYLKIQKDINCPNELFQSFTISVVTKIYSCKSNIATIDKINEILKEYSNLFTKKKTRLGREREQGLFGELVYLENLINKDGDNAIISWTGPDMLKHDFVIDDKNEVEVKTTTNQKQLIVTITSENQLEKDELESLKLKVYLLEKNPYGEDIVTLIDRIKSKITDIQMLQAFNIKISMFGIDPNTYKSEYFFKVLNEYEFEVDDKFPKLCKTNLPGEIFDVKYKLNLNNIKKDV